MTLQAIQERIREAAAQTRPLRLRGGGTKDFYGERFEGEVLDTRVHAGIVDYEPSELVITVRCGTPLTEVESTLNSRGQCLPFEPPYFGPQATIGGCVAAGFSGPRRMSVGALRDYVLGVKLIDGQGRALSFGGQVMKNVAGYDVSRLLAGSLGTLALISDVSLKVLPVPPVEQTMRLQMSEREALRALNDWGGQPLPISASAWHAGELHLRLSGAPAAVDAAYRRIGGERLSVDAGLKWWSDVREQKLAFFQSLESLWRVAVPTIAEPLILPGTQFIEWNGGLRWWKTTAPAELVREAASQRRGHATLFRTPAPQGGRFTPLEAAALRIHRNLKAVFDPAGIFNRGRLYADW
ncbi:MAG TPA: glycolate oxidase subunit GlcE [Burkholderiales bacterium]|nr:glycolate oxidase subunit GlcE [Burkholderiales bacterium]